VIVFDLKCEGQGHMFEGWFGSSADYEDQKARGLLSCPMCGDANIVKALMAPAVASKGNSRPARPAASQETAVAMGNPEESRARALMRALAEAQNKALEGSTWVGRDFAEQARAMYYGEQDRASIHGEVAPEEARALISEGVDVTALPFPVLPPKGKN
jgi:hypothetical protein